MIYLDNAATSHPKPEAVYAAADGALRAGGNPGRGGNRLALAAGRRVLAARTALAGLLGISDPARLLFTDSATGALHLALHGTLRPGDRVVTTRAEHNALRRPLLALARAGVQVTWLPVGPDGRLDLKDLQAAVAGGARLVALAHASNVTGALQPLDGVADIARTAGALLLVDAAQTAGVVPIHPEADGIDLLACPGHKGLLGPTGTGFLFAGPAVPLRPVRSGGTGTMAVAEEQPVIFPEGFESGTVNVPGIAGLGAAAQFLQEVGVAAVRRHEAALAGALAEGLRALPGVTVYGPDDPDLRAGVVSFNVAGMDPAELEELLDDQFGICGRAGLHCNPGAHQALGTLPDGTMRLSPGFFNTVDHVEAAVAAVRTLVAARV